MLLHSPTYCTWCIAKQAQHSMLCSHLDMLQDVLLHFSSCIIETLMYDGPSSFWRAHPWSHGSVRAHVGSAAQPCGVCRFFQSTPNDLIVNGLYHPLAVPFHDQPFREVSLLLAGKQLGASCPLKMARLRAQAAALWRRSASYSGRLGLQKSTSSTSSHVQQSSV